MAQFKIGAIVEYLFLYSAWFILFSKFSKLTLKLTFANIARHSLYLFENCK